MLTVPQFAKIENNIIIAHFISMFDFELSDKHGNPKTEMESWNMAFN
jgi:hypothetical protein